MSEAELVELEVIDFKFKDGEVKVGQSLDLLKPMEEIVIEPCPSVKFANYHQLQGTISPFDLSLSPSNLTISPSLSVFQSWTSPSKLSALL